MTKEEMIRKYEDWIFRCSAYNMALTIIGVDKETVAPAGGSDYRDAREAFLAGELFNIVNDPEILDILKQLKEDSEIDPDIRKAAQLYYKQNSDLMCIPKEEFMKYRTLMSKSYGIWRKAKVNNDYALFEPVLKEVIEGIRKNISYRNRNETIYNQLLDDFEPGMTTEKYDVFFGKVRERLVPLIRKVKAAKQIDDSFLYQEYPVEDQKKFMEQLLKYLHFDPDWGYQNETEHPFTSFTCENDCRTTTKYQHNDVVSAILSTVHEVGHAYYEHNCDPKYNGMILSDGISSGMHESQSRFCENYLGRSKAFWEYNYPVLQSYFPEQLKDISLDEFVDAINVSRPSLVRTEADELTYPLHIMIRYEIEKGLFDGTISTSGLDQTWNRMYEEYLGVTPDSDSNGILQDVHWAEGLFGYFPTYALGSAFAAQFMNSMKKDVDVADALANNRYTECIDWLKDHIHRYGCRYNSDEIMRMATGEAFNTDYYLDYLEAKYKKLYQLD